MNAVGIAVHNVVKGLRLMRTLYADGGLRILSGSPDAAARRCLFAPKRQSVSPERTDGRGSWAVAHFHVTRSSFLRLEKPVNAKEVGHSFLWMTLGVSARRQSGCRRCWKGSGFVPPASLLNRSEKRRMGGRGPGRVQSRLNAAKLGRTSNVVWIAGWESCLPRFKARSCPRSPNRAFASLRLCVKVQNFWLVIQPTGATFCGLL